MRYGSLTTAPPLPMTSCQANQQKDIYFSVMRILHDNLYITQRELAIKLGVNVSGLNYCPKALINKGLVKIQNFINNKNKLGPSYLLTSAGFMQKPSHKSCLLQRKMQEYEALKLSLNQMKQEVWGWCSP